MKHEKIKELLPLYIDGGLTEQEKKLVKEHLQNCEECREELKKYRENRDLLSSIEKEKAPAGFDKSVLNKIYHNPENEQFNNKKKSILKRIKNFFTLPVKVPAGVVALAVVVLLVSITGLPGIFLGDNNFDFQGREESLDYRSQNYNQISQSVPDAQSTPETARLKMAESPEQNEEQILDSQQKLIQRANLIIELKDIDTIDGKIINLVKEYNGYISNSRNWLNQDKQKFYWFELRVPSENFERVLEQLSAKKYGQIISRTMSSQDVTEEYMDLDIRLGNLLSQEERYRQLLDKAGEVEEILKIENELNRVRTEIERLQGRKKYLDNRINFSTITIEFHQPEPLSSGTPGILKAIRNAVNRMVDHFYKIIIFAGTIIPYLILLVLGYFIYRRSSKN